MNIDRTKARTALESPKTMAATLYLILTNQYGDDWLEWDPATIYMELRDDFNAEPAAEVMDRISSLLIAMNTGEFFSRFEAFSAIVHSLNTGAPSFTIFNPVEAEEIGWAVTELSLLRDLLPFDYSVRQYIKQALTADGYSPDDPPAVVGHVLEAKDPSANIIRDITTDRTLHEVQHNEFQAYIDEQLKDLAAQLNELGLGDQLDKMLAAQEVGDVLVEA